ncbi:hypothetical protein [Nocardia mexicana]|uniref:Uncharacterized protein n=1 Tax=Nocardia mexicana TaxID=279262 RepID=A0A370H1A1_9NOCA|nr:hypothetical protein [Nocardia mexicana]RDI49809.1 hypothetical protein DFR68_106246 [Nocardia mexicana]
MRLLRFAIAGAAIVAVFGVCGGGVASASPGAVLSGIQYLTQHVPSDIVQWEEGEEEEEDEGENEPGNGTTNKTHLAPGKYCGSAIRTAHYGEAVVDSTGNSLIDNAMYTVESDGTIKYDDSCHNCVMERGILNRNELTPRCNY